VTRLWTAWTDGSSGWRGFGWRLLGFLILDVLFCGLVAWTLQGTRIAGVDDSEAYIQAEHELEARELCGLVLSSAGPVLVEAGNTGRSTGELAREACELDAVAAPFLRLLESGVGEQLEVAKFEALEVLR
jgi:hypothetical protein